MPASSILLFKAFLLSVFIFIGCNQNKPNSPKQATTASKVIFDSYPIRQTDSIEITAIDQHIRSIYQDSKGTYWIGTNAAGVYRYDQNGLRQFTTKDGLADNQIISIQEDSAGVIWFGTGGYGISRYNGTHIETFKETTDQMVHINQLDIKAGQAELWFCAGDGAFVYDQHVIKHLSLVALDSDAMS